MENAENQVAVPEGMTVEEPAEQAQEVNMDELIGSLTAEPQEPEPEQETEPEAAPEEEPETPEQARNRELQEGIRALFDAGMTRDEMDAFVADNAVRRDIADGKSVMQAALAHMRRQTTGAAQKSAAKRSVPTLRSAATQGAKDADRIAEMSDEEFARFAEKAERAAREGKKVAIR